METNDSVYSSGNIVGNVTTDQGGDAGPDLRGNSVGGNDSNPGRKRGRPKGSKNRDKRGDSYLYRDESAGGTEPNAGRSVATDRDASQETVSVQEQKPRKRRSRVKPQVIENPGEVASTVINTIEAAAVQFIGDEAKFEPFERFLIEIGAHDAVSRVSPETAARVASIVSPVCLIGGLALYGFRVASVVMSRVENSKNPKPEPDVTDPDTQPIQPEPSNGFKLSNSIVPPYTNLRTDQ